MRQEHDAVAADLDYLGDPGVSVVVADEDEAALFHHDAGL